MVVVPGCRAGRCEAACGGRWHLAGRGNTAAPGQRRHPPRPGLMHAERGNPVEARAGMLGRPTVRDAELLGGNRMPKKLMPAAERQRETTASNRTLQPGRA